MTRIERAAALAAFAVLAGAAFAAAADEDTATCGAWSFVENGGVEGGQPMAAVICGPATAPTRSLSVLCGGPYLSVRLASTALAAPRSPTARPKLTYRFGEDEVATYPIYEAAEGDWAVYLPVFDDTHPLLSMLRNGSNIVAQLAGDESEITFPLKGSSVNIQRVEAICAR